MTILWNEVNIWWNEVTGIPRKISFANVNMVCATVAKYIDIILERYLLALKLHDHRVF